MKKQNLIVGLILSGCAAAVACTSSGDDAIENTGGTGGATGGSAGTHAGGTSAGSAGKAAGGASNGGGSAGENSAAGAGGSLSNAGASGEGGATGSDAGAGGEAGGGGFVIPRALDPWTVLVPSTTPATFNHLLVAGTDFASSTEITSITLIPAAVGDTTTYQDGDTVPVSSAGLGFALEETNDKVHLLDGGKIKTTFDVADPGTDTSALADNKAYAVLYNQTLISILDLSAGKVSRRIDLTQFNDASDSDGSADITAGAYDSTKHIAYFVLARIDRNAIAADPSYHLPCTATRGLIVGIDTTTDAIVDLNGAADGKTLPLSLVSPTSLALSANGASLTLLASGCYEGATLKHQGVEVVDLTLGTSLSAYAPTGADFLDKLVLTGGTSALLHTFDTTFAEHWFKLDLGTGALGTELSNVPDAVSYDGADLLGVKISGKVGAVVRYNIANDATTEVTPTSWSGQYSAAAGSALVE
jgi:hypothetical protein